jgi:hypothetical protein
MPGCQGWKHSRHMASQLSRGARISATARNTIRREKRLHDRIGSRNARALLVVRCPSTKLPGSSSGSARVSHGPRMRMSSAGGDARADRDREPPRKRPRAGCETCGGRYVEDGASRHLVDPLLRMTQTARRHDWEWILFAARLEYGKACVALSHWSRERHTLLRLTAEKPGLEPHILVDSSPAPYGCARPYLPPRY